MAQRTLLLCAGFVCSWGRMESFGAGGKQSVDKQAPSAVGDTGARRFALQGGYVEVTGTKVIILADRVLPVTEIDATSVREELLHALVVDR